MVGWGEKGHGGVLVCAGGTRGLRKRCHATRRVPGVAGWQAGVAQGGARAATYRAVWVGLTNGCVVAKCQHRVTIFFWRGFRAWPSEAVRSRITGPRVTRQARSSSVAPDASRQIAPGGVHANACPERDDYALSRPNK